MHKELLEKHFETLQDPRIERTKKHALIDIIAIAICAVICGADTWTDIEDIAHEKRDWFASFLRLENGIPSHDTFARVFARLNPVQFRNCFNAWVSDLYELLDQQVIAIDGKTARRSHDHSKGLKALHLVSAWATEQNLTLGQVKVDEKSNEITAIPELLKMLVLKKAIVTIDAMGCQREIAEQIHEQGGDYVLAVKDNQGTLKQALENSFKIAKEKQFAGMVYDQHEEVDGGHGRIETRRCYVLPLMYLFQFKLKWRGLKSLVLLESTRQDKKGAASKIEYRYYISSLPPEAKPIMQAIRKHWDIESNLHWSLDVSFHEDLSRIREKNSQENFAAIRRMAFSLLKRESSFNASIKRKRFKALLHSDYLVRVLNSL